MIRRLSRALLLAAICTAIVAVIALYRPLWQPFEQKLYDLKYRVAIGATRIDDIVIVDIDDHSLQRLGRYQNWPRAYFAEVVGYLRQARVVGLDVLFAESDTLPILARQYFQKPDFDSVLGAAIHAHGRVVLVSAYGLPSIFSSIANTGIGQIVADADGVVRRGMTVLDGKPTFAAQVAKAAGAVIEEPSFLMVYHPEAFRLVHFSDVYLKRIPPDFFRDKIVLVGGTAAGLFDYHAVPFRRHFPGLEIQANLVYNIIHNEKINGISRVILFGSTFLLAFFIALAVLGGRARVYVPIVIGVVLLSGVGSVFAFTRGVQIGLILPMYCYVLTLIGTLIVRYRVEEREKRRIKAIFSRYYSRELVDKIIATSPRLGGERTDCTVLFADIRNFTTYAESNDPEEVGRKLNALLTELVEVVFFYQGRIDKYIGDCVMAVFGSPLRVPNHAANACRAARDMIRMAKEVGFRIGVGVNTGEVISGNFGSPMRMEYTVIGDNVNLASRLEGLTKEYDVGIVVSQATRERAVADADGKFEFRPLGPARVKGKEQVVEIFELVTDAGN